MVVLGHSCVNGMFVNLVCNFNKELFPNKVWTKDSVNSRSFNQAMFKVA